MASLLLTACLSLSAAALVKGNDEITWGSVVFTYHGEKIPALHDGPYNLTPLGANQLLQAGQTIRDRYISSPSNSSITGSYPIDGLQENEIDNGQMSVLSTTDEYITASALAFMQGLYPPRSTATEVVDEESIMGNGTLEQFPLNGYQYPNIASLSLLDFNYIWLAGNINCTNYSNEQYNMLVSSDSVSNSVANEDFYGELAQSVFSGLQSDSVNYDNAWDLYEYALYQNYHNQTVYDSLAPSDLDRLYSLASEQQWSYNTPNSGSYISSIAGQTMASKVIQQLATNIASDGVSDKLTLMFGSYEPFLSFFALSGLSTGPAAQAFNSLPQHGSVMAFELFSNPTNSTGLNTSEYFPTLDELFVRFFFRNGTNSTDTEHSHLTQYPLFGRGNSEVDMSWTDFVDDMSDIALYKIEDWCTSCGAVNLFCEAIETNTSESTDQQTTSSTAHKNSLSPAIAGVVGAAVTLAVGIIAGIILCLFGFRVDYRERKPNTNAGDRGVLRRSGSGIGGFKGAEKLASDTDLRMNGGAGASVIRHERVGSWELNEAAKTGGGGKHSSLDKEIEGVRAANYRRPSEDSIGHENPFGDPVKPLDQV
ncbi:hypothetical protein LSUB1_G006321 [Lachnellula subtilissima]|uniref:Phosphoglycerate mutase-like protein n=1 Tax=Lachnellula subtilissima TaxID=602034 RepID=A0A8H8U9N9_9HELO|nr:hypothetical protein LSUB1_G006321 [Lachnellula subtilissima]